MRRPQRHHSTHTRHGVPTAVVACLVTVLGALAAPPAGAAPTTASVPRVDPAPVPQPVTLLPAEDSTGGPFVAGTTRTPPVQTDATAVPTFTTDDATVCAPTSDGHEVVLHRAGACTVTVQVAGNAGYTTGSDSEPYTVVRATRTLVIEAPTEPLVALGTWTPAVTGAGADANKVVLTTDAAAVCEPGPDGTILLHQARPCTVTAALAGDDVYAPATDDIEVTPALAPRTVVLATPTSKIAGVPWTPAVTATPPGDATFVSDDDTVCGPAADAKSIRLLGAGGTCTVRATVATDGLVHDAGTSAPVTFTVLPRPVTLQIAVSAQRRHRSPVTITVTATDQDPTTAPAATISGTGTILVGDEVATPGTTGPEDVVWSAGVATRVVTPDKAGSLDVRVSLQPTPATSYAVVTSATSIEVGKATQTASFTTPPITSVGTTLVGTTWSPAAVLDPATEPDGTARVARVVSDTTAVCTVTPTTATVTFVAAGLCTLRADHPGGVNYEPAPVQTTNVPVVQRGVKILLSVTPAVVPGSTPVHLDDVTVSAMAVDADDGTAIRGSGTLSVTSSPTATVTPLTATGSTDPAPWTATQTLEVLGGSTYTAQVSFTALDTTTYAAYVTGTDTTTFEVQKVQQTLAWSTVPPPPTAVDAGDRWTPVVVRGETAAAVVISTSDSAVCGVDGTQVVFLGSGTCTVTATQGGDEHYLETAVSTDVEVRLRAVTVEVTLSSGTPVYDDDVTAYVTVRDDRDAARMLAGSGVLTAPGVLPAGGVPLTYAGGTATFVLVDLPVVAAPGTQVTATFVPLPADARVYEQDSDDAVLVVQKAPQEIVPPTGLATAVSVGDVVDVLATVRAVDGGSGQPVTGSVVNGASCSVLNPATAGEPVVVTFNRADPCRVDLDLAGGADHTPAAQAHVDFTVARRGVLVRVATLPDPALWNDVVDVKVSVIESTGQKRPVPGTVTVTAPGVTEVQTAEVDENGGSTTIRYRVLTAGRQVLAVTFAPRNATKYDAISAGDPAATQGFDALARPQTIAFVQASIPSPAYVARSGSIAVSGAGDGTPVLTAKPDAQGDLHCTVAGLVVTFSSSGDCLLEAYREAVRDKWAESPRSSVRIPVVRIPFQLNLRQPDSGLVGTAFIVRATARDTPFRATVPGSGTLALERLVDGAWQRVVPDPTAVPLMSPVVWDGGSRSLSVTPTRAGSYRAVAAFTPTTPTTYELGGTVVTPNATFEVAPGSQQVAFVGAPTSAAVLDSWLVTTTTADSSPRRPVVSIDVTSAQGSCTVGDAAGTQVVTFTGLGDCVLGLLQPGDADYDPVAAAPLTVTVIQATTAVGVVGQTVAQPVVGDEHIISIAATTESSRVPVPGRFVLTTADGITQAQPAAPLGDGGTAILEADFTIVPTTRGTFVANVTFEPVDATGISGSSTDLQLQVLAGTQRLSVATSPSSSGSYVGDEWNPEARVQVGPGAPVITPADPSICDLKPATGVITLLAAGRCSVTFTAPATAGGDWNEAAAITRSFDVAINPTSLDLAVIVPAVRPEAWVDETITLRAVATGIDSNTPTAAVPGTVAFVLTKIQGDASLPTTLQRTVTVGAGGLAVWNLSVPGDSVYSVRATLSPAEDARWAVSSAEADDLRVVRRPQTLNAPALAPLPALTTWTSTLRSSGDQLADVRSSTLTVCTASERVVTLVTTGACVLTFSTAANDRVYIAATPVEATIVVTANATAVSLVAPAAGTVGADLPLTAIVRAPLPVPAPGSGAVATGGEHPVAGTVQFWVTRAGSDAVLVDSVDVTVIAGTDQAVTGTWTPDRSTCPSSATAPCDAGAPPPPEAAQTLSATLVLAPEPAPAQAAWLGSSSGGTVLAIAKGAAGLEVSVSHVPSDPPDRVTLSATVTFPGRLDPAAVGGSVVFDSNLFRLFPGAPEQTPVTVVTDDQGSRATAVLVTDAITARFAVKVTASYSGTFDILGMAAEVRRDVPAVVRLDTAVPTGWQHSPVTFRYACTPTTGALLEACPDAVTVSDEGISRRRTFAVVADDGGTTVVTTPAVDIDTTAPTLTVEGVRRGAVYNGFAAGARCRGTDATSGLSSCASTTTRVDRETRRVSARAVDKAGNVTTDTFTFRELQEWVVAAPRDAHDRFAVTPGKRIRIETITRGARRKPQLVVRRPGQSWRAVATMVPSRLRDGYYTWYGLHHLPRTWRPSTQVGVRVGGTVTRLGLVRR